MYITAKLMRRQRKTEFGLKVNDFSVREFLVIFSDTGTIVDIMESLPPL
jgi:hypothetical protein